MIKTGDVIKLKDGRKGKVVGQLENREWILQSKKGGQISHFKEMEVEL